MLVDLAVRVLLSFPTEATRGSLTARVSGRYEGADMLRRVSLICCLGIVLQFGGCFPNYFFENLLGSTVSSVWGVFLSDALNVLFPPPVGT